MKFIINFLFLISALALFISCDKRQDIEIKLPKAADLLVVNGHFSEEGAWEVALTKSRKITTADSIAEIANATMELYEDGTLIGNLLYTPAPFDFIRNLYRLDAPLPKIGKKYTLKVSAPGYETVETTDTAPASAVEVFPVTYKGVDESEIGGLMNIRFKDNSTENNYYHILLKVKTTQVYIENGDTTYFTDDEKYVHIEIPQTSFQEDVVQTEMEGNRVSTDLGGYVFDDRLFNGGEKSVDVIAFLPAFFDDINEQPNYIFEIRAEVRTVSEAYFRYQRSLSLQEETGNSPFAEPVFIFNNVKGGLGNFSGYSPAFSEVLVLEF